MGDHTRTRDSVSPTASDSSSVDIILTPLSSPSQLPPPSPYASSDTTVNHSANYPSSWPSTPTLSAILNFPEIPSRYQKAPGIARAYLKRRIRLQQRLGGPAALVRYDAVRLERKRSKESLKESMAGHVKDACMKRELKRAMKTKISPQAFQRIHVAEEEEDIGTKDDGTKHALLVSNKDTLSTEKAGDCGPFAGQIVIQDHLTAITQALSEHCKDGPRRKEPGRHSFHVDAAVSKKHDLTGIGVTFKTHRQDWASLWTAKGYQICKTLEQNDAEMWAVWQAMEIVLEKIYTDSGYIVPSDPCSLAVIYTDSQSALHRIGRCAQGDGIAARIGNQAKELQELGVNIELHWVPGHEKIPGNELADRMAKQATFYPPSSTHAAESH